MTAKTAHPKSTKTVEDTIRGRFQTWMNQILKDLGSPFAYVDVQVEIKDGAPRFADIVIWKELETQPAAVIELKPPSLGWTPYDPELTDDALHKATKIRPQSPYYGTWNTNELVIWATYDPSAQSDIDRRRGEYSIARIKDSSELGRPEVEESIKKSLTAFLRSFAEIYSGKATLQTFPPDAFFIAAIRSTIDAIYYPIAKEIRRVAERDEAFRKDLNGWFAKQQWLLPQEEEDYNKAARQFAYLLLDKVLFYNALRLNFPEMRPIHLPRAQLTEAQFKAEIQRYFDAAQSVTRDFEAVFATDFVERLPIPADIVPRLVAFVNRFARYDMSKLSYGDIGRIYDKLIPEAERHKLGQYFTKDDVVDVINGFCINGADSSVADFGCGVGTFLVRAYAMKKWLNPSKTHEQILSELYGVDISKFPAHLATINLAIRDLGAEGSYPQIANKDFFELTLGGKIAFGMGGDRQSVNTLDQSQKQVAFVPVDAVVGNPPYTRQEELEDIAAEGYKEQISRVIARDWGQSLQIGKRAGIYAYFLVHGLRFVKEHAGKQAGGRMGYVVSNAWLDVDYGRDVQEFLLDRTKIIAVIESKIERWFEDADVNTCIVVLERCLSQQERDANIVRFVQLRKPLSEILDSSPGAGRFDKISWIIHAIVDASEIVEYDWGRVYPIAQSRLRAEGTSEDGDYVGAKWGRYTRAPDIYYKILTKGASSLVPLSKIADVNRGITSGANEFFYVTDDLIKRFGIEKEFWTHGNPKTTNLLVKSPKDSDTIDVDAKNLRHRVLLVHRSKQKLRGTHLLRYIELGEKRGYHKRPTCASREPWYDLGSKITADILFVKDAYSRHLVHRSTGFFSDCRFYEVRLHNPNNADTVVAFLNSTYGILFSELAGRTTLGLGARDIMTYEAARIPVLDPDSVSSSKRKRIEAILNGMARRNIGDIFDEIGAESPDVVSLDAVKDDRRKLDAIIGECLGLDESDLLDLYRSVVDLVLSRIQKAKSVEKKSKGAKPDPVALAKAIFRDVDPALMKSFPDAYLRGAPTYLLDVPGVVTEPKSDLEGRFYVETSDGTRINCESKEKAFYVFYAALHGRTRIAVPLDPNLVTKITRSYSATFRQLRKSVLSLLESYIPDRKVRQVVEHAVWQQVFRLQ